MMIFTESWSKKNEIKLLSIQMIYNILNVKVLLKIYFYQNVCFKKKLRILGRPWKLGILNFQ